MISRIRVSSHLSAPRLRVTFAPSARPLLRWFVIFNPVSPTNHCRPSDEGDLVPRPADKRRVVRMDGKDAERLPVALHEMILVYVVVVVVVFVFVVFVVRFQILTDFIRCINVRNISGDRLRPGKKTL
jgi:hypothetical protein